MILSVRVDIELSSRLPKRPDDDDDAMSPAREREKGEKTTAGSAETKGGRLRRWFSFKNLRRENNDEGSSSSKDAAANVVSLAQRKQQQQGPPPPPRTYTPRNAARDAMLAVPRQQRVLARAKSARPLRPVPVAGPAAFHPNQDITLQRMAFRETHRAASVIGEGNVSPAQRSVPQRGSGRNRRVSRSGGDEDPWKGFPPDLNLVPQRAGPLDASAELALAQQVSRHDHQPRFPSLPTGQQQQRARSPHAATSSSLSSSSPGIWRSQSDGAPNPRLETPIQAHGPSPWRAKGRAASPPPEVPPVPLWCWKGSEAAVEGAGDATERSVDGSVATTAESEGATEASTVLSDAGGSASTAPTEVVERRGESKVGDERELESGTDGRNGRVEGGDELTEDEFRDASEVFEAPECLGYI